MDTTPTLTFDEFWQWLVTHPNCILRAGTKDAALFDDDDYHWHFAQEGTGTILVQVVRGKRLVGELLIPREQIAYVQGVLGDHEEEFVFELITGDEQQQTMAFFFVLGHGYEAQEEPGPGRVH